VRRRRVRPQSRVRPTGAGAPELRTPVGAPRACRVSAPAPATATGGDWHLTPRGVAVVTALTVATFVLAVVAMVGRFLVVTG
ncbi:hypothetical protein, partial [Desertihabitans aurantiacus]|uniref:hypothetical protein n=1 Tax=Desertihabitans aurantiacus TaxID=2282477 RepID=UPI001300B321